MKIDKFQIRLKEMLTWKTRFKHRCEAEENTGNLVLGCAQGSDDLLAHRCE